MKQITDSLALLVSPIGETNRAFFWLVMAFVTSTFAIGWAYFDHSDLRTIALLSLSWPYAAVSAKRLRHIGMSPILAAAPFVLASLIYFLGMMAMLATFFVSILLLVPHYAGIVMEAVMGFAGRLALAPFLVFALWLGLVPGRVRQI